MRAESETPNGYISLSDADFSLFLCFKKERSAEYTETRSGCFLFALHHEREALFCNGYILEKSETRSGYSLLPRFMLNERGEREKMKRETRNGRSIRYEMVESACCCSRYWK